jgi:hypothetical protein
VLLLMRPPWQKPAAAAVILVQPTEGPSVPGLLLLHGKFLLPLLLVLLLLNELLLPVPVLLILPMRFFAGTKQPHRPRAGCRQGPMGRQLALLVAKCITGVLTPQLTPQLFWQRLQCQPVRAVWRLLLLRLC